MHLQWGNKNQESSVFLFPQSDIGWGTAFPFPSLSSTPTTVPWLRSSRFRPQCWQNPTTVHEKHRSDVSPYLNHPFLWFSLMMRGLCEVKFPFSQSYTLLVAERKKINTSTTGICWNNRLRWDSAWWILATSAEQPNLWFFFLSVLYILYISWIWWDGCGVYWFSTYHHTFPGYSDFGVTVMQLAHTSVFSSHQTKTVAWLDFLIVS